MDEQTLIMRVRVEWFRIYDREEIIVFDLWATAVQQQRGRVHAAHAEWGATRKWGSVPITYRYRKADLPRPTMRLHLKWVPPQGMTVVTLLRSAMRVRSFIRLVR